MANPNTALRYLSKNPKTMVVSKTFGLTETAAMNAYLNQMKDEGYTTKQTRRFNGYAGIPRTKVYVNVVYVYEKA